MKQFEIVTNPIEAEQYRTFTLNEHQGAVVVFTGHVREWTKGVKTEYLEYEAYVPMAQKKLEQIGEEITQRWPGTITTIVHRIGPLQISDIAVLIVQMSMRLKELKKLCQFGKKKFGKTVQNGKDIKEEIIVKQLKERLK